ncbi:MAG: site-specific integrase [Planctomycetota bacterium]
MGVQFPFSKRRIEALGPPAKGREQYRDAKTPGLVVRVTHTGAKSFAVYKKVNGRPVRFKLGTFPTMTVEQARRQAADILGEIAKGKNPAVARHEARHEATVGGLFAYWLDYARQHKRTWKEDERLYNKFLKPWANRQLSSVTRRNVEALHARVGEQNGRYQANRLLAFIRAAFNKADRLDYHGPNPTTGIKKFPEESRDRYLEGHELRALFVALTQEESLFADFILLALLTGARRGNLQAMQWADVNLDLGVWRIPQTKSGRPVLVPLIPAAVEILTRRFEEANGSPWVFPTRSRTGHLVEPKTAWKRVCARAGLPDLRLHDLRRSLGSWQAKGGASLPIIGKSLGHQDGSPATSIYARLAMGPVRESVEKAGNAMLRAGGLLSGPETEGGNDE